MKHWMSLALVVTTLTLAASGAASQQLKIGGSQVGGTFYVMASGIATLIEKHLPGYSATATPAAGSVENIRRIRAGQLDMAMVVPDAAFNAFQGQQAFSGQKYPELRTITNTYAAPLQIVSLASSPIRSIADLRGKKLAVGVPGGLEHLYAKAVLEAHGLTVADVKLVPMGLSDRISALADRNVDVAFLLVGLSSSAVKEMNALHDVRYVPVSKEGLAKLRADQPFYNEGWIRKGTFKTVTEDVLSVWVVNPLITRADMPEDLVYRITKLIFEKKPELVKVQALAEELDSKTGCLNPPAPLHPGAARFFRESGCLK